MFKDLCSVLQGWLDNRQADKERDYPKKSRFSLWKYPSEGGFGDIGCPKGTITCYGESEVSDLVLGSFYECRMFKDIRHITSYSLLITNYQILITYYQVTHTIRVLKKSAYKEMMTK